MCGQPAAETFQDSEMCIGRPVDIFLQNVVDVGIDMSGVEFIDVERGKGRKTVEHHSVMDLCTGLITANVIEPSGGCFCEELPCSPLQETSFHFNPFPKNVIRVNCPVSFRKNREVTLGKMGKSTYSAQFIRGFYSKIEERSSAWEAGALPLSYAREFSHF